MQEVLMTPDLCMRFLIWSYYYHDIIPEQGKSYGLSGLFLQKDVESLDLLNESLFRCFEASSVINAVHHFQEARIRREPCPFSQEELDGMFARSIK